jgi:LruC domain-containing protein
MAAGSVQENGFGFELGIKPEKVASVTGHQVSNVIELLGQNNVEYKQDKAVVIAFDKSLTLLGGGKLINTEQGGNGTDPVELKLTINLVQPINGGELGTAPYNPFMFVSALRGKEVHLPGKPPTTLANAGFFGAADDATDPAAGVYYVTKTGLPYALNIPMSFSYPIERTPINTAHLKFSNWVQSGGSQFSDWYKNLNGYRANNRLFNK